MNNQGKKENQASPSPDDEPIRVTDRRRIHLDGNGKEAHGQAVDEPTLKPTYVEELERRTKAAEKAVLEVQARFEQLREQLQREMEETRQRLNRASAERAQLEKASFITSLLPVLDNLQRATGAAATGSSPETVLEGVRQTVGNFENALNLAGVEAIQAVGQPFDPTVHEAVDTVVVSPDLEGKVISEYERGYKMGDILLRPARVQVGRAEGLSRTVE
jgi:molecular chaperone GrpE